MGGPGSGNRWHSGAKSTTDDYRTLDVRRFAVAGVLRPNYWGGWRWTRGGEVVASIQTRAEDDRIILIYRHRNGGEWKDEEYPVRIERTRCHLGGSRPWFICPALGCGKRVAILYGGGIFACRHCYELAYASSREEAGDRTIRRADRLRARLGWEPGILNGEGGKPKWMRSADLPAADRKALSAGQSRDAGSHAKALGAYPKSSRGGPLSLVTACSEAAVIPVRRSLRGSRPGGSLGRHQEPRRNRTNP